MCLKGEFETDHSRDNRKIKLCQNFKNIHFVHNRLKMASHFTIENCYPSFHRLISVSLNNFFPIYLVILLNETIKFDISFESFQKEENLPGSKSEYFHLILIHLVIFRDNKIHLGLKYFIEYDT